MSSARVREPAIDTTYVQGGPRHGAAKHGPRAVGGERAMGSAPRTPHVLVVSAREHPVAAALEQHGYIVLRARTGAAAAAALNDAQQAPPDALLVIDGMPDMEGPVLAQRLRDGPRLPPDTPIFVVAPSPPTVPQHRAALRAGVCEFLLEPLDGDHLAAKLASRLLARDAGGGAGGDPATGPYDVQGVARRPRGRHPRGVHHPAPPPRVGPGPPGVGGPPH